MLKGTPYRWIEEAEARKFRELAFLHRGPFEPLTAAVPSAEAEDRDGRFISAIEDGSDDGLRRRPHLGGGWGQLRAWWFSL